MIATGFHGEGRWMFTASEDGHLKIWDTRSGRNPVLTRNFDNGAPITDAVMHANQGELITCDQNGAVKIWDLTAHSCTHELVCCVCDNMREKKARAKFYINLGS